MQEEAVQANVRPQDLSSDDPQGGKGTVNNILGGKWGFFSGRINTEISIKFVGLPWRKILKVDQGKSPDSTRGSLTNATQNSFNWEETKCSHGFLFWLIDSSVVVG